MVTRALAGALVAVVVLGGAARAGAPAPTSVLERSCLNPDAAELAEPWRVTSPAGVVAELWCGDRLEVSGGRCVVRRGGEATTVPCRQA